MSSISAIGTATPKHRISQSAIAAFMVRAMGLSGADSRKLQTIFRSSGIEYRHSVLEDYNKDGNFSFYPNSADFEPFPSTEKRLCAFHDNALPLSVDAVQDALKSLPDFNLGSITHLIVVCCTGMYAPGLDIDLVKALKLPSTVKRTSITFMGCYAAFNALKVADAVCTSDPGAKVLVVCTELCSLHFQKTPTEDNLLANALFADGAAALVIEGESDRTCLKVANFYSDLALEGEHDMAWKVANLGFEMKLSSYVPLIIKNGIKQLAHSLLKGLQKTLPDIRYFAIHPGGKRILEVIEQELNLSRSDNKAAYTVLQNYGNMSSPTVLFVLKEIFSNLTARDDDAYILSFAFGPGLTLESAVFQINYRDNGKRILDRKMSANYI